MVYWKCLLASSLLIYWGHFGTPALILSQTSAEIEQITWLLWVHTKATKKPTFLPEILRALGIDVPHDALPNHERKRTALHAVVSSFLSQFGSLFSAQFNGGDHHLLHLLVRYLVGIFQQLVLAHCGALNDARFVAHALVDALSLFC